MKKLISSLAGIPFSIIAQQFPEAPMCFYALKTVLSLFVFQNGYKTLLAMDMKTHGCTFQAEKPVTITKVGYRAWTPGITYRISLWQVGQELALSTCCCSPKNTEGMEFFSLIKPVQIVPGNIYYITRTYISGGPNNSSGDCVGWLNNKQGGNIYPVKQHVITLTNGFFSDDVNPLQSESMSNISTGTLLPYIDFGYTLRQPY
uniref:hypothetical protein n=1 Tax=Pedobacter schmidteae TaxID=2201271 RepID=UPI000EB2B75E|nr:hypothetical protein [Pedobacter schmidteae]